MLRAGVIGCGRIGCAFDDDPKRTYIATHAGAYVKSPATQLVALSDWDDAKLSKYGKRYGVTGLYRDYREMFRNEPLDLVSICTRSPLHGEIVEEAVKAGIRGIFCEKPIAENLMTADRMIRCCEENRVILQIDHQRRFDPLHQSLKSFLQKGGLGEIQQASCYYTAGIANTGSHLFDLIRFFLGEVHSAWGIYSRQPSPNPEDPNIDGMLQMENGCLCTVQACDVKQFLLFEMDLIGTRGRIRLINSGFGMTYYRVEESRHFSGYRELSESQPPFQIAGDREFMINAVNHLTECVSRNIPSISSGFDGRQALEIVLGLRQSAMMGGSKISFPVNDCNALFQTL